MILGTSSPLQHTSPEDWAAKHKALGLKAINFPVNYLEGEEKYLAYKKAADAAGLSISEVGIWRNTLAADPEERAKWINYAIGELQMAEEIGATCCVNVVGTPYGPRWDGGYRDNFSTELWTDAVKMIRQVIDSVRPRHTKFCIESMPWMIPSSPQECLRLLEDVDRAEFATHLDVVNMITSPQRYFFNDDFLRECFSVLKGTIVSCHLKNIKLKEEYTFQLEESACEDGALDLELYASLASAENPCMPMIIEHLDTDQEYFDSVRYVKEKLGRFIL
ncbi:MAG: TIM barrel protein [Bacteroidales bacterium]|nr:TIM barrel protein [Bacteroidales bacterium]